MYRVRKLKSAVWAGSGCMAVFPISGSRLISPPGTFSVKVNNKQKLLTTGMTSGFSSISAENNWTTNGQEGHVLEALQISYHCGANCAYGL